jgi:curli biogenesis system outer membrane secretion channel CsgG
MSDRRFHSRRRILSITLAIAAATLLFPGQEAAGQSRDLRYTVMVAKFENRSNWSGHWELGSAWGAVLTDQLNQTGRFIVVAESDMREEAMAEQARVATGATAQGPRAPTRGQMTPAQLLVKGVITHFQHEVASKKGGFNLGGFGMRNRKETAEINVTLQMVDSTTGMVVASKSVVGSSTDKKKSFRFSGGDLKVDQEVVKNDNVKTALAAAVGEAIDWMTGQLDRIPWRGSVVLVRDDQIYIDRGAREGVTEGLSFSVGESEIIRNPSTGEVLDEVITERARIQAVRVQDRVSICKVTAGDASTIYEGMGITPASVASPAAL